jgi:hypothetical protein
MKATTKGIAMLCAAALALTAVTEVAEARPRPRKGKKFEANKTFGIGIMLGAPTAFNGKYFYASDKAFDFAIGAIRRFRGRDGLHLHFDHLWHPVSLASTPSFELPLYIGIGARFFDFDDNDNLHGSAFGIRGPVGIAFDLNNTPLDIFFEIALVLDFYDDYNCAGCDDLYVDANGAIGLRYYFQ